jgi:DNA-directed RNA polymerase subunit beta'
VKVRSPLRCKTVQGICQKCYGTTPGTNQVPSLGAAVGVMAAQALGEPVMQMTMNTFHSGGTSSNATIGLPRVKQLLDLSEDHNNPAVLSKVSGTVTAIDSDPSKPYDTVTIDKVVHVVPHTMDNKSKALRVSVGDKITKGDFITVGDIHDINTALDDDDSKVVITNAAPKTLFELKQDAQGMNEALDYVKDYITGSMEYSFNKTVGTGKIDRKHLETIISKLGSKGIITDPGDSQFIRGQDIDINEVIKWNADNTNPYNAKAVSLNVPGKVIGRTAVGKYKDKKGNILLADGQEVTSAAVGQLLANNIKEIKILPRPIQYQAQMNSKGTVIDKGHTNWLSNMAVDDVYLHVSRGAATGQTDKLNEPRTRLMTGKLLNVGKGYELNKNPKTKDTTNSIASKMLNFFTKNPFEK